MDTAGDAPPSYTNAPSASQATTTPQPVVVAQQPGVQPTQQVVYVDQFGNPIQPAPQQTVVVVQQAVPQQGVPMQAVPQQGIELQVNNTGGMTGGSIVDGYYVPSIAYNPNEPPPSYAPAENNEWKNDDEVPPDYASTLVQLNQSGGKGGHGIMGGCLRNPHFKAWFLTLWLIFFITCYIWTSAIGYEEFCRCTDSWKSYDDLDGCDSLWIKCDFPADMTWKIGAWFWVIVAVTYLLYLLESFCMSSSGKYLNSVHDGNGIVEYIEELKGKPPTIHWHVECYHYERYRDSNGNSKRRKRTTHTADANYRFTTWRDNSMSIEGLDEYKLTKLKLHKTFTFANSATENHYNWHAQNFRDTNNRDQYQNFTVGVNIDGFVDKVLLENSPGSRGCISRQNFNIFSALGCTTCFRMYFGGKAGTKEYLFTKEISI